VIGYLLIAMSATILAAWAFARELHRRGVARIKAIGLMATCVVCSWPIFVCLFTCNQEIVIGFLVGIGLCLFLKGRGWSAALLFGLATGLKIFPFVFITLYLVKKQYRQMAFFLGVAAVLNVFSLWLLSGSILVSTHGISQGLESLRVRATLVYGSLSPGIDHSLFSLVKASIVVFDRLSGVPYPSLITMSAILRIYMIVMAITGVLLYFLRIRFLPILNQVFCLSIASILFTPLSLDYTLMHLYVPLGMLILAALKASAEGRQIPGMSAAFGCLALLLAPLCEFMGHGILVGALIKCLVLVFLLVLMLRLPIGEEQDHPALSRAL
jgi:hypothetical protein